MVRIVLVSLLMCTACLAVEVRPTDRIVPLIQDGDGWHTSITLVNLENTPARFELLMHTRIAQPWVLPVTGVATPTNDGYVRGTLPANGSISIRTNGPGSTAERGYAFLFSPDGATIGITASVQQAATGTSLAIPQSPEREDRFRLPFDNTGGANTSLLWLSETPYAIANYTAVASDGTILLIGRYQFSAQDADTQDLFSLAERFPELKDCKGTIIFDIAYPNATIYDDLFFSAFAIQSFPQGGSVAIPSMSDATWRSNRY